MCIRMLFVLLAAHNAVRDAEIEAHDEEIATTKVACEKEYGAYVHTDFQGNWGALKNLVWLLSRCCCKEGSEGKCAPSTDPVKNHWFDMTTSFQPRTRDNQLTLFNVRGCDKEPDDVDKIYKTFGHNYCKEKAKLGETDPCKRQKFDKIQLGAAGWHACPNSKGGVAKASHVCPGSESG